MGDLSSKLLDAVERENLEDIIKIIEAARKTNNADIINKPYGSGTKMTPLLRTVWRGNVKITKWMVEEGGADVNIRGKPEVSSRRWPHGFDMGCDKSKRRNLDLFAGKRSRHYHVR